MKILPLALLLAALVLLSGCNAEQPPFTQAEFERFLTDARAIKIKADEIEEVYLATYNKRPGSKMNDVMGHEAELAGWDPDRYLYIYGRCVIYGAYVDLDREFNKISDAMTEARKHDKNIPAPENYELTKGLARQVAVLKQRMEETLPVSERVFLHERQSEVMKVVRKPDLMNAR